VKCPNKSNPGIQENAQKALEKYRATCKKNRKKNSKKRNLETTNLSYFDEASQQRIWEQVLQSNTKSDGGNATSVVSAVTTTTNQSKTRDPQGKRSSGYIIIVDVQVLAAGNPLKQPMPISIQSNLPHIALQLGIDLDCPNFPTIRCAVDTCAALSTGSFHFFASLAKRFPHCVAKIFAPKDYSPIILSGIVQSSEQATVTTELEVGWQFHLPYKTKTGETTSFAIATGPHVFVNTILGLPFQKATGAIIDLVDNVVQCKHLDCPPFNIDFRHMSNHVPAMDKPSAKTKVHFAETYRRVIKDIENLEHFYDAKVLAIGSKRKSETSSVHFGSEPTKDKAKKMKPWQVRGEPYIYGDTSSDDTNRSYLYIERPDTPMPNTPKQAKFKAATMWGNPPSVNGNDDYSSSVLKKDSYL
jgi:hypothetical protein